MAISFSLFDGSLSMIMTTTLYLLSAENFHFLLRQVEVDVEDLSVLQLDFSIEDPACVQKINGLKSSPREMGTDPHLSTDLDRSAWSDRSVDVEVRWGAGHPEDVDLSGGGDGDRGRSFDAKSQRHTDASWNGEGGVKEEEVASDIDAVVLRELDQPIEEVEAVLGAIEIEVIDLSRSDFVAEDSHVVGQRQIVSHLRVLNTQKNRRPTYLSIESLI